MMTTLAIRDDQTLFDDFQLAVLRQGGVEEVYGYRMPGYAPHNVTPCGEAYLPAFDVERHASRYGFQYLFRSPQGRCLGLVPPGIEVLGEIPFPMEEGDPHHGHPEVGGGPERVASQHPQTAGVRGDGRFKTHLHRKIRNAVWMGPFRRR